MKIYFSGRFELTDTGEAIFQRLEEDFRAKLLGDAKLLTIPAEKLSLKAYPIEYAGGFYFQKNDTEVIVKEKCKEIKSASIFVSVLDKSPTPETVTELIDACHFGKSVVIFYEKQEGMTEGDVEGWYPIARAKELCKKKLQLIPYEGSPLNDIANYLTDLCYKKLYASTVEFKRDSGELVFQYTYQDKEVSIYKKEDNLCAEETYKTGLVVVKSLNTIKSDTLTKVKKDAPLLGGSL